MIQKPRSLARDALVEQLRHIPGKAEIVDGEIVLMSPAGYRHFRKGNAIYLSLVAHEEQTSGIAFYDNVGFIVDLPNRQSFSPDAGWLRNPPDDDHDDFVFGAPTFAVEVRSKSDFGPAAEKKILAKIADYFAAGTLVVWDVDVQRERVIRCYRAASPTQPQVFGPDDIADAEPAVPGWRFATAELFR